MIEKLYLNDKEDKIDDEKELAELKDLQNSIEPEKAKYAEYIKSESDDIASAINNPDYKDYFEKAKTELSEQRAKELNTQEKKSFWQKIKENFKKVI